jgi:hypothetical protein
MLCGRGILAAPQKRATVNDIHKYILESHPHYHQQDSTAVKARIRSTLNRHRDCFVKTSEQSRRGNHWMVRQEKEDDFPFYLLGFELEQHGDTTRVVMVASEVIE